MLDLRGEVVDFLLLIKEKRDQFINKYVEDKNQ